MKKILFIIQSYPSEKSANVLCDDRIIQELLKTGEYEIHCLTYQYDGQSEYELVNGVIVHRWNRGIGWKLFTWAMHHEGDIKAKLIYNMQRLLMRVKQVVFIPIFPFYEPLVAKRYAKKAVELAKKHMFDMVIAEHNGLDTLYAGWKTKQNVDNCLFVPIFWDSLSGGFPPKYLPIKYVNSRKKKLEYKILHDADKAIAMLSHKEHLEKIWGETELYSKIEFLDIPYLTIRDVAPVSKKYFDLEDINIVFAGNMGMRDPSFFFELVSASVKNNIKVSFYTRKVYHKKIIDAALKYNVRVEVFDYVPHEELIGILKEADVLLNFGVDNPNAVSGKIFDYMGFGKPIISTFFIDNEAILPILAKYSNSLLLDERKNIEEQVNKFDAFLSDSRQKTVDLEEVSKTFYRNLPATYRSFISELINTDTGEIVDGK